MITIKRWINVNWNFILISPPISFLISGWKVFPRLVWNWFDDDDDEDEEDGDVRSLFLLKSSGWNVPFGNLSPLK